MKHIILTFLLMLFGGIAKAQDISGRVTERGSSAGLPGANVYWLGTTQGLTTDMDGRFEIALPDQLPASLVISYVGFSPDTVVVNEAGQKLEIKLSPTIEMQAVEIAEERETFSMSAVDKLNTETINRGILRKAACCNLSESFEASASVDVVLNDAVTGTRKIQMLGLEGVYVQNLFEGIPFSRGLGNVQAFDQIPGPWISSIQLTKGIGTVQNGYESLTGQINIEFLPSDAEETLYLDLFANNQSRLEANAIYVKPISERWSTALFVGANSQNQRVDMNDDGFLDMPLNEGVKLMNRWKYKGDFFRAQLVGRYIKEERTSGQTSFDFDDDFGNTGNYGFGMDFEHYEVLAKAGILSGMREDRSLAFTGILSRTLVDSYFGNTRYEGTEQTARLRAFFESKFSEFSDHKINAGAEFLYDDFEEAYADSAFSRTEEVPGVFVEYTYERPRFTAIVGARADFHNLYGNQYSPRLHLKYNLKPLTTVRATLGRGFRAPNVFADQLGYLASSRTVRVLEAPEAEASWNTGLSFLHKFDLFGRGATFNTDYYFTSFENQLVVDRDFSPNQLLFYNLQGESTAHSFQTDVQAEVLKGLGVKLSYKYQFVEVDYLEGSLEKPLVPNHRAMFNIGYTSPEGKWYLDFTANYYGAARMPSTEANPPEFRTRQNSEDFFIFNSQITRTFGGLEVYVGTENLGNFIQQDAIIDPENPFGSYFDATLIYGPLNGRTFYAGARYTLKTNKK